MATILDGKAHADRMLEEVRQGVEGRLAKGLRAPALAVVLVGDDPASHVYVRNKSAACARVGITSIEHRLAADTPQAALDTLIDQLNADPGVDGILVQLPLPEGLDSKRALHRISPAKDVDGFHPINQGLLLEGLPGLRPCTPTACMSLLAHHGVALKGIRAVVLGRSEIVGKPMALMLLEQHATVTIAHSRTQDLAAVFAAEPKKLETLRTKGGVLCGDVRFGEAMEVASAVTPVPGGVGPLTIAGLLSNTLVAANQNA